MNWGRGRAWIAIWLTAIGIYFVGSWQGARRVGDLLVTQQAQTALDAGKSYRALVAKLLALEQHQSLLAGTWRHRADSLRARALRVDTVTVVAASDSSALGLWRATANAEHETARSCAGTLQTCQERAQAAMSRAARLDSLLRNVLKVQSCRVLFLRCPSRTTTFLFGSGLGLIGGFWLGRH